MRMDFKEMPHKDVCWINLAQGSVPVPAQYVISCIQIERHCTQIPRQVHIGYSRHLLIISIFHSIIEFQISTYKFVVHVLSFVTRAELQNSWYTCSHL
jgi:hypothetical protein